MEYTDLEICKRIAKINGDNISLMKSALGTRYMKMTSGHGGYREYNPLTDDNLCFKLMVKYKVLITWNPHINDNCTAVIDGTSDELPFPFAIADVNNESPNRAICLAIIESHKLKGK